MGPKDVLEELSYQAKVDGGSDVDGVAAVLITRCGAAMEEEGGGAIRLRGPAPIERCSHIARSRDLAETVDERVGLARRWPQLSM